MINEALKAAKLAEVLAPEATTAVETSALNLLNLMESRLGVGSARLLSHEAIGAGSADFLSHEALNGVGMMSRELSRHETIDHALLFGERSAAQGTTSHMFDGMSDAEVAKWIEKPQSMTPKAFKFLTPEGASPGAPEVRWSLPRQAPDGSWQAGEWQLPRHSNSAVMSLTRGRSGLFVTDNLVNWQTLGFTGKPLQAYEVQIGDVASARAWAKAPNYDFVAQRVRILRPLSQEEVAAQMPR